MKTLFKWLVIITFLLAGLRYTATAAQGPVTPTFSVLILFAAMIYFLSKAFQLPGVRPTFRFLGQMLTGLLRFADWLTAGLFQAAKGSRWAKWWETASLLKARNRGFLLDGNHKRLSVKDSFNNVLVASPVGAGKTTVMALPNIYALADTGASLVVMDVKPAGDYPGMGELYRRSSGYLARKGYQLRVFNLLDPRQSLSFNPLDSLHPEPFIAFNEIQAIAGTAINTVMPADGRGRGGDTHWSESAKKHTITFTNALRALAAQHPPFGAYCNLPNVRHLLSQCTFYRPGNAAGTLPIDHLMLRVGHSAPELLRDYHTAMANNPNTISSEIATALTALATLANPSIANLLGSSSFSFASLRQQKTALFFTAPVTDLEQGSFNFIVKVFFNQLLNHLRRSLDPQQRPVFLLLDEVGHFGIDNLPGFMGTAREFRVGVMGILQSIAQLDTHYGRERAKTIRENMLTQGCFGGTKGSTADYFSREIGQARYAAAQPGGNYTLHREDVVISPSEISTTKNKYLFCTHANRYPMKFKVTPYYKHSRYRRYAALPPIPINEPPPPPVRYLDLEQFQPALAPGHDPNLIVNP